MVVIEIKNCTATFHGFPYWENSNEKKLISFTTFNEILIISDKITGSDQEFIVKISNPTKNALVLEFTDYACPNSKYIAFLPDEKDPNKFYQIPYEATDEEFIEILNEIHSKSKE
ncbi:MAG: hypothetical protein IJ341_02030 [Bacteroidales bacterium]|nr:hypothetical protein [Bacteroidales bacterium]